jgi:hypothetical protein
VTAREADPLLKRLERNSLIFCAAAAAVALGVRRGSPDVAAGVLGGGLLIFISYWAIKTSIDGLLAAVLPASPPAGEEEAKDEASRPANRAGVAGFLLRLVGRYALLGFAAYVMIARLRLHPVGLLIGVSSAVFAATVEAIRTLSGPGRRAAG